MYNDELPIIKLELDRMRYSVVHAFNQRNAELEEIVNEELEKALENFSYAQEIRKVVDNVLQEAIKRAVESFFMFGGGQQVINEMIGDVLNKISLKVGK